MFLVRLSSALQAHQRIAIPAVLFATMTCYVTIYAFLLPGTGRFRLYVGVNTATTLAAMAGILSLVALGRESYVAVAALYVLSTSITIVIFETWWRRWSRTNPGDGEPGNGQGLSTTWRRGVVLFSASALLLLMFSIDKLAVATQYSKSEFAEYAFAAGVLGIVYLALDALAYAINPFIGGELEMGAGITTSCDGSSSA